MAPHENWHEQAFYKRIADTMEMLQREQAKLALELALIKAKIAWVSGLVAVGSSVLTWVASKALENYLKLKP